MTPTEVRSRLIENGYVPVPCDGKNAKSAQWERYTLETARAALTKWARDFSQRQQYRHALRHRTHTRYRYTGH